MKKLIAMIDPRTATETDYQKAARLVDETLRSQWAAAVDDPTDPDELAANTYAKAIKDYKAPSLVVGFDMKESDLSYRAYLINPTKDRYSRIVTLSVGFSGDDDSLSETSKSFKDWGPLEPNSYLVLEESDWDGLDWVICFDLDAYRENSPDPEKYTFHLPKYGGFQGEEGNTDDLPVLNIKGRILELGIRTGAETIEQAVKHINMKGGYYPMGGYKD